MPVGSTECAFRDELQKRELSSCSMLMDISSAFDTISTFWWKDPVPELNGKLLYHSVSVSLRLYPSTTKMLSLYISLDVFSCFPPHSVGRLGRHHQLSPSILFLTPATLTSLFGQRWREGASSGRTQEQECSRKTLPDVVNKTILSINCNCPVFGIISPHASLLKLLQQC